jgi:hypothetical protein
MGNVALSNIGGLGVGGDEKCYKVDITMSSSYATSGDTFDSASIPLNTITRVLIPGTVGAATSLQWTGAGTTKIIAYAGSSQVSNTTDLSGVTATALFFGR